MKYIIRNKFASLAIATLIAAGSLVAQDVDPVTQKTTLLSDAIKARESGDLATARDRYLKILKIDATDEGAKEGLASINSSSLLDSVANNQQSLLREIPQAIAAANEAADHSDYATALKILDGAKAALPNNTGTQSARDDVSLARQEIIARRESGDMGADHLAHAEIDRLSKMNAKRIEASEELLHSAKAAVRKGDYDDANASLDKAKLGLPINIATDSLVQNIEDLRFTILANRSMEALDARELAKADGYIREYEAKNKKLNGINDSTAQRLRAEYEARKVDPLYQNIDEMSPGLRAKDVRVEELLVKGRARYLYGDYTGALDVYREVLQYQPNNAEAKAYQVRIRQFISENSGQWNRGVTKGKLIELVDESWKLPEVYNREVTATAGRIDADPVQDKLRTIVVPELNMREMPFDRAVQQLIQISQTYDKDGTGVNMVLLDPEHKNPTVNLNLRNLSLEKVIDLITKQANFASTINQGILELRPDSGSNDTETEFFPLSSAAETKMTGLSTAPAAAPGGAGGFSSAAGASTDVNPRNDGIKSFLTRSGVSFEVTGAQLNYDGTTLIVTQNRKNLDRIRNILRRYSDIKQVHIEAKFIEVSETALHELTSQISLGKSYDAGGKLVAAGTPDAVYAARAQSGVRSLDGVFGTSTSGSAMSITAVNTPPSVNAPAFGSTNFGGSMNTSNNTNFAGSIGSIGSYDLSILLRALEQNSGSDIMSAPSLTVLDGKTATIKIAQLLRYPKSYGDTTATASAATTTGGGDGTIAITAGTPQDFDVEAVGVTLEVTPTVGADDSIALNLKPTVTEFEGFVEYGGTSVAIAGATTVTVPSGFFQPIFNTRSVVTDVTVYDGATVVIGGLNREEVKSVHDKVPVLGDIPFLGAAFRSDSKSTIKKNLSIFVTANLVSPGGATLRSSFPGMRPGSTFQNPVVISPGGAVYREPVESPSAPQAK